MKKLLAISGTAAIIASLLVVAAVAPAAAARGHRPHRGHHRGGGGHPAVTVSEADNGHAVTLHRGQRLQVILHSTYWTFDGGTDTAVLARHGDTQYHPGTRGKGGCPSFPGSGCGTAVQGYQADGAGTSTVTATRTSCGEVLMCSPEMGTWSVDVTVVDDLVLPL
jgi:hypothetical protein